MSEEWIDELGSDICTADTAYLSLCTKIYRLLSITHCRQMPLLMKQSSLLAERKKKIEKINKNPCFPHLFCANWKKKSEKREKFKLECQQQDNWFDHFSGLIWFEILPCNLRVENKLGILNFWLTKLNCQNCIKREQICKMLV